MGGGRIYYIGKLGEREVNYIKLRYLHLGKYHLEKVELSLSTNNLNFGVLEHK
jgi:hypothetical protein